MKRADGRRLAEGSDQAVCKLTALLRLLLSALKKLTVPVIMEPLSAVGGPIAGTPGADSERRKKVPQSAKYRQLRP
jgi:hypothetical protein